MPRSNTRSRVAAHRAQLRARRLRPVQIRVPDTRAPGFAEEARRQSVPVDADDALDDLLAFLERVSVFDEDEADEPTPDAPDRASHQQRDRAYARRFGAGRRSSFKVVIQP